MNDTTLTKEEKQYKRLTEEPVARLVLELGLPTTISMLITNLYNMVDTWFVSQLGTSATGAVGVVFGLMAIIQAFGFMFGHGAGSNISRLLGAHEKERAKAFSATGFYLAVGAGVLIAIIGIVDLNGLCRLLGSTETILPYARIYAFYILVSAPAMASSCVMNNVLRYEGYANLAMVKTPGSKIFPYLQKNLDDVITVEDEDLVVAFLDMVENHKMIVENSGLLTVAALKQLNVKDKRIVSILSGGNMDVITMSSVVQQGLILRDRIFTVSVLLPDKPGELCRVSGIIAGVNGNVIKLEHNQFVSINRSAAVELRITLEAFGTEHKNEIIAALEKEGYQPKVVRANI